jgi:drug/metabolite transporter (DMT)-like permease
MNTKDIILYTQYGLLLSIIVSLLISHLLGYKIDTDISSIPKSYIGIIILRALLATIMPFFIIYLMTNYKATQALVQIRPIVIALTVLIGVYGYGEKISNNEYFAISLIMSGVIIINLQNN